MIDPDNACNDCTYIFYLAYYRWVSFLCRYDIVTLSQEIL